MKSKLNNADRQAVDLVLDRFATIGRDDGITTMAGAPAEPHVQSVEKILSVLSNMPAAEPADDLMARTLRRIENASGEATQPRQVPPYLGPGQLPA